MSEMSCCWCKFDGTGAEAAAAAAVVVVVVVVAAGMVARDDDNDEGVTREVKSQADVCARGRARASLPVVEKSLTAR